MEVLAGQFGIHRDCFAPHLFRFVFLAHGFQRMAQVQHGVREIGLLIHGLLIALDGRFMFARGLQQQSEIVGELKRALAQGSQLLVQLQSLLMILALDGDGRQRAHGVGIFGLKLEDAAKCVRSGIQILELPASEAEIEQRLHPVFFLLETGFEAIDCAGVFGALELEEAQAKRRVFPIGLLRDQLFK